MPPGTWFTLPAWTGRFTIRWRKSISVAAEHLLTFILLSGFCAALSVHRIKGACLCPFAAYCDCGDTCSSARRPRDPRRTDALRQRDAAVRDSAQGFDPYASDTGHDFVRLSVLSSSVT